MKKLCIAVMVVLGTTMLMAQQNDPIGGVVTIAGETETITDSVAGTKDEAAVTGDGLPVTVGQVVVAVSPDFYRPTDVVNLLGDPSKAKRELGWNPQSTSFEELVELMGGNLEINSEEGMGTTVWITLPCRALAIKRRRYI